ncbi:MAG: metallophosphoesterase family protein [Proteobacteria bacterium]|nr:metallophosphoesterase family protein [Pseudomonadota bacterium]
MKVFEEMGVSGGKRIGIIADSHGRPQAIVDAANFLYDLNCDKIIHLGDICDTLHPETCDACLATIQAHGVFAVKGNNDHMLQLNQEGNAGSPVSEKSLRFLRGLAPVIETNKAFFAHSLPFYEDMGIACITRALGKNEIKQFFALPGERILFRGHSHTPELIWEKEGLYYREVFSKNQTVQLKPFLPCIITCGALTRSLCMVWNMESQEVTCLSVP